MSNTSMAPKQRIPYRSGFIALTLVLLVYVSFEAFRPEQRGGLDLLHIDKLLHFAAFASLAIPARLSTGQTRRAAAAVVAGLLLYGGFIEVVQAFIPGRDSSWLTLGPTPQALPPAWPWQRLCAACPPCAPCRNKQFLESVGVAHAMSYLHPTLSLQAGAWCAAQTGDSDGPDHS